MTKVPPPLKPKPKLPPPVAAKKPELASCSVGGPKKGSIGVREPQLGSEKLVGNDEAFVAGLKPALRPTHSGVPPVAAKEDVAAPVEPVGGNSVISNQITLTKLDDSDSDDEPMPIDDKLKTTSKLKSGFPPPPRRTLPSRKVVETTEDKKAIPQTPKRPLPPKHKSQTTQSNADVEEDAPSLPRRPVVTASIPSDSEEDAPKLPSRPTTELVSQSVNPRPSFLSPKKPARLDSRAFPGNSDDEDDEPAPPLPMRRDIPRRRSSRHSSYSVDSDEELEEEDELKTSHSSLLFNSAKKYSKSGYHAAVEKSTPYAKQAKSSIGKWTEKIKNSTASLPDANHDGEDYDEEEYYKARRERARSIRSQTQTPETEEESGTTPIRPVNGRALPGMEQHHIPHNSKPEVPLKPKPAPPPKKRVGVTKSELPPQRQTPPPNRSSPPPVTPRSVPSAPPSRQAAATTTRTVPPPPPTRGRPAAPSPRPMAPPPRGATPTKWVEPELDLELPSLWFAGSDMMHLPACFKDLNCQISAGFAGDKQFRTYAFRGRDLSTIKLKLVWKKDSPSPLDSLTQDLSFIPPPTPTKEMLIKGHTTFGEHVASWCEVKMGHQVGNGECWTLAHDALQKGCGNHAFVSSGLIHGALLCTVKANGETPDVILAPVTDNICRGDILQFKSCFFKYPTMTMTYGAPDHTAVVLEVNEGAQGGALKKLKVIHQNVGGVKTVSEAEIDLGRLKGGDIKIYRPVEKGWVKDLMDVLM